MKQYIIYILFLFCFSANVMAVATKDNSSKNDTENTIKEQKRNGDRCLEKGELDNALKIYNDIIAKHSSNDDSDVKNLVMGSYINCGYIYSFHMNNYAKAYECYQKAENISIETGITNQLPFIYLNKASVYANYNDSTKVVKLYQHAFYSSIKEELWGVTIASLTNIIEMVDCYAQREQIKPILDRFASLNIPDMEMLAFTRKLESASYRLTEQKWDAAIADVNDAISLINNDAQRERYEMTGKHILARIYLKKHDYANAIRLFVDVLNMSNKYQAYDCMNLTLGGLRQAYRELGDTQNADNYKSMQVNLRDSLFSTKSYAEICDIESSYEIEKMENRVTQLEEERNQHIIITCCAVLGCLVVFLLLLLIAKKNKDLNEQNKTLYAQNERFLQISEEKEKAEATQPAIGTTTPSSLYSPELLQKIKEIMSDIDIVTREDFSLSMLAELTDSKERYVSQAINEGFNKNLSVWLAEIRVKEACKRIKDVENYGNLSIEGIAKSLGYKSRSHFATIFKKETGLSPSEYQKQALLNSGN